MGEKSRLSRAFGIGVLAALLAAFSTMMAVVSVALYRVEREDIDGNSEADRLPASSDER